MDVDGTLTDGKIYMGASGELMKSFNIKDGYGINNILNKYNIVPMIITGRKSEIVMNRAKELNISRIYQNSDNKFTTLINAVGGAEALSTVAAIGDDIPDLLMMEPVKKAGGIIGCPKDAVEEVKKISDFIAPHNGGDGAVRDFIEWLLLDDRKIITKE